MTETLTEQQSASPRALGALRRVGAILFVVLGLFTSLLTFPSSIALMVGFWFLWASVSVLRRRPGWLPLAVSVSLLLVKGVDLVPAMLALILVSLTISFLRLFRMSKIRANGNTRVDYIALCLLWCVWIFMAWDRYDASHSSAKITLDPPRCVLCVGDSLTAGLIRDGGYPKHLTRLLAVPVENVARPGITTEQGTALLKVWIEKNPGISPQIVIIELGGNDYAMKRNRADTLAAMQRIVQLCKSLGADILLVECPRGFVRDQFHEIEREIARNNDLELVPDSIFRYLVLWGPHAPPGIWLSKQSRMSDDGIHPNRRGDAYLAHRVAAKLATLYGDEILATR